MGFLDATWHLLNLFYVPVALALLGATMLKWGWRLAFAGLPWRALAGWAALVGSLATLLGLMLWERDGRMATYALILASESAVWTWQSRHR